MDELGCLHAKRKVGANEAVVSELAGVNETWISIWGAPGAESRAPRLLIRRNA